MKWKSQFQEFIYAISTDDKYSEFDSRKSFNRINKPETEQLYSHHANNGSSLDLVLDSPQDIDASINKNVYDGVHETKLAWRHISNWLAKNAPDLKSSLQSPCTSADLSDFQKDLNIKLPNCIVEFLRLTDGQSLYNDNGSGGVIFGLKLLPLEEIMIMTEHWRKVAITLQAELSHISQSYKVQELSKLETSHSSPNGIKKHSASSSTVDIFDSTYSSRNNSSHSLGTIGSPIESMKKSVVPQQRSIPPGRIHDRYAHPMWIPIITDEVGNCIGVDLSPPNKENWGQIILFGRDFDTKFVIADNFGDFLLIFANDLENGNWEIQRDETNNYGDLLIGSEGNLVFVDRKSGLEVGYLQVLKKRSLEKWVKSLDKSEDQLDGDVKQFIQSVKDESKSFMNVKNPKSIDAFINTNLELIDKLYSPMVKEEQFKVPLSIRPTKLNPSPLKVVTENAENSETTEIPESSDDAIYNETANLKTIPI